MGSIGSMGLAVTMIVVYSLPMVVDAVRDVLGVRPGDTAHAA
jgi:hypothetical protein